MNAATACPGDRVLRALLLGRLPPPLAESWNDHLLNCPHCAERAATLKPHDALSDSLAAAKENTPGDCDPFAAELMRKLLRMDRTN